MDIPISSFKIKQKGLRALLFYLSISDLVMLQVKNILFSFFIFFVLANQICAQELEPLSRIQDMKEIHVNNGNQVALAQLLLHSVQTTQPSQVQLVSKAYLEVKSYLGGVQLELVEADFNINHGDSSAIIYHGEASLQAFQIGTIFTSPQIYFEKEVPVYRKLMALPYAQKFWMANPEPIPNAGIAKRNQMFCNQAASNNSLLQQRQIAYNRVYEHPYIPWSERRVLIREDLIGNAQKKSNQLSDISALYHLEAQLYYDIIQSADTFVLMSSCILDPYQTYYKLSVDPAVN